MRSENERMSEENIMEENGSPEESRQSPAPEGKKKQNKLLWTVLFIVIAACSIWAVVAQAKDFSLRELVTYLKQADYRWMLAAVLAMLGFIVFEACALRSACGALRYPTRRSANCVYAAADIYFSAITPSATGGQPACAFLMMRDGIPGTVTTAVLLLTLAMYSLAILAIGLLSFIFRPGIFLRFSTPSKCLIVLGFAAQVGLSLFFFLLIRSERLLERICRGTLRLLGKLHLLRDEAGKQEKLRTAMEDYRKCAALLAGHRTLLLRSFLFNFLQRASQISVTMLVYLAMGGTTAHAVDMWAMQSYAVLGSNCVPIPGAMGVADYLMLDGIGAFVSAEQTVIIELLSRSVSFYSCIILCGVMVLFAFRRKKRERGKK